MGHKGREFVMGDPTSDTRDGEDPLSLTEGGFRSSETNRLRAVSTPHIVSERRNPPDAEDDQFDLDIDRETSPNAEEVPNNNLPIAEFDRDNHGLHPHDPAGRQSVAMDNEGAHQAPTLLPIEEETTIYGMFLLLFVSFLVNFVFRI